MQMMMEGASPQVQTPCFQNSSKIYLALSHQDPNHCAQILEVGSRNKQCEVELHWVASLLLKVEWRRGLLSILYQLPSLATSCV